MPDNDTAADPPPLAPAARDCVAGTGFARDDYRRRAHAWWSSMAAGHALVVGRERAAGKRFDAVVFSRPDVLYDFPFGPHCEYDAGTWYAGGKGAPDNFWILPRAAAASVLNSLASFYACAGPTEPCCVRTHRDVSGATMFSWWITARPSPSRTTAARARTSAAARPTAGPCARAIEEIGRAHV